MKHQRHLIAHPGRADVSPIPYSDHYLSLSLVFLAFSLPLSVSFCHSFCSFFLFFLIPSLFLLPHSLKPFVKIKQYIFVKLSLFSQFSSFPDKKPYPLHTILSDFLSNLIIFLAVFFLSLLSYFSYSLLTSLFQSKAREKKRTAVSC